MIKEKSASDHESRTAGWHADKADRRFACDNLADRTGSI